MANSHWGTMCIVDYFAQDQYKELDPNARVLDDIGQIAPRATQTELRTCSARFFFPKTTYSSDRRAFRRRAQPLRAGSDADAARQTFCFWTSPRTTSTCARKMSFWRRSRRFEGTVVFVSHDRYFLDEVATRVFEVGDGGVHVFPGNYEDYVWRKNADAETLAGKVSMNGIRQRGIVSPPAPVVAAVSAPAPSPVNGRSKLNPVKLQKMKDKHSAIESRISSSKRDRATRARTLPLSSAWKKRTDCTA